MDERQVAQKMIHLAYDLRQSADPRGCRKLSMTLRDMLILHEISTMNKEGLIKMNQIRDNFKVSPAAVSQGIRSYEEKGWVERVILESDRRSVYIRVTDKGHQLMKEKEEEFTEMMMNYFSFLGEQDSAALIRILERTVEYRQQNSNQKEGNKYGKNK